MLTQLTLGADHRDVDSGTEGRYIEWEERRS